MSAALVGVDLDIRNLKLDVVKRTVKNLDRQIADYITDGDLERTMDGASTLNLTVHDPKRVLLRSGMFAYRIDVTLDGRGFRLVKVGKQGDDLNLTFEDREVARLRDYSGGNKHASRSKVTRAEFALSLVREAKPPIPFVCPELHKVQTVEGTTKGKTDVRKLRASLPFQFRRGGVDNKGENTWDCLQRLAQEVEWRCFVVDGAVWFASEPQLLSAAPRMTISEDTPGVAAVDFDIDSGKVTSEVQITARASRWAAPPGSVVELRDLGPADGKWLVHSTQRSIYDADATITLKQASKPNPEPAAEQADISGSGFALLGPSAGGGNADLAYAAAQQITSGNFPYVWGGGHAACGTPDGGTGRDPGIGFDCSGSVCAVLAAAGMGFVIGKPGTDSSGLMSWGEAGEGSQMTVWANSVHTFIIFHLAKGDQHFGTGRFGTASSGPGLKPQLHTTAGFTARHWPGS